MACYHPDVTQFPPAPPPPKSNAATKSQAQESAQAPICLAAAGFAGGRRGRRRGQGQEPGPAGGSSALAATTQAFCGPSKPPGPCLTQPQPPLRPPVPVLPHRGTARRRAPRSRLGIGRRALAPPPRQPSALRPRKGAVSEATPRRSPARRRPLPPREAPPNPLSSANHDVGSRFELESSARPRPLRVGRGLGFAEPLARPLAPPAGRVKEKQPLETIVSEHPFPPRKNGTMMPASQGRREDR